MDGNELGILMVLIILWFICGGPESTEDAAEETLEAITRIHVW